MDSCLLLAIWRENSTIPLFVCLPPSALTLKNWTGESKCPVVSKHPSYCFNLACVFRSVKRKGRRHGEDEMDHVSMMYMYVSSIQAVNILACKLEKKLSSKRVGQSGIERYCIIPLTLFDPNLSLHSPVPTDTHVLPSVVPPIFQIKVMPLTFTFTFHHWKKHNFLLQPFDNCATQFETTNEGSKSEAMNILRLTLSHW